jgi:formylglycine-generating enzyme required for sulfatase activity
MNVGPAPAPGPRTGQTKVNPKDGLTYVWIPAGTFAMGCSPGDNDCKDDERPVHQVTIKGLWMGQTEVTQAAYERVTGNNPNQYTKGGNLPVSNINWNEATSYCESTGMRLPTEPEWEYAARAGSRGGRYGDIDQIAWYHGNFGGKTLHAVKQKQPNAWGLYDMLGNVAEWTASSHNLYAERRRFRGMSLQDPRPEPRVVRGGSSDESPQSARASARDRMEALDDRLSAGPNELTGDSRAENIGVRCAGN